MSRQDLGKLLKSWKKHQRMPRSWLAVRLLLGSSLTSQTDGLKDNHLGFAQSDSLRGLHTGESSGDGVKGFKPRREVANSPAGPHSWG